MAPISAIPLAIYGLRENLRTFEDTAVRLARSAPGGNLAGDLVDMKLAEHGVRASVAVVRAADDLVGTLLDALA